LINELEYIVEDDSQSSQHTNAMKSAVSELIVM
jgi:hypothetical protein